jgi:glycerol uptake facilitator-like aquaporin
MIVASSNLFKLFLATRRSSMSEVSYAKRCIAEAVGTGLLLATVVGSGIMGERLAAGNVAIALLANSIATGAGLSVFILLFEPISGAHFNPLVTLSLGAAGRTPWKEVLGYVGAQLLGAFAGVAAAHLMFGTSLWSPSTHARPGFPLIFSEVIAAFGLLAVVLEVSRRRPNATAYAVGAYILAAYWFTGSTSFANPAVTIARAFTDTFTGIRLADVPGFILGQFVGATAAVLFSRWLAEDRRSTP